MDRVLNTTAEVMDAVGGTQAVADLTGSTYGAAWQWRAFDTFPSKTYVVLMSALEARGKTAPASLWGMVEGSAPAPQETAGSAA